MGGGLMQLVAYGAQDIYLTGNPQITFFKVVYRRHTNFSMESIEQTFNGTATACSRVTATISRNGDLVHKMYIRVVNGHINSDCDCSSKSIVVGSCAGPTCPIPVVPDSNAHLSGKDKDNTSVCANDIIDSVEIEIGGQKIDKHYGDWLNIWTELTTPASKSAGTEELLNLLKGKYSYVPLQFWFNRNPGLALPLIALQYHEVKVNIEFSKAASTEMTCGGGRCEKTPHDKAWTSAKLFVDYIYLDTDERRRFAQVSHEYLIEQLQYTGAETIPAASKSKSVRLNFNHPVKELIWRATGMSDQTLANLERTGPSGQNEIVGFTTRFVETAKFNTATGIGGNISVGVLLTDHLTAPTWAGVVIAIATAAGAPINACATVGDFITIRFTGEVNRVGAPTVLAAADPLFVGLEGTAAPAVATGNTVIGSTVTTAYKKLSFPVYKYNQNQAGTTVDQSGIDGVNTNSLAANVCASAQWSDVTLQLNGHERFAPRHSEYFRLVQPLQHHTAIPVKSGIHVYSFALKPEEHQPSGTCNFSRIDNAVLKLNGKSVMTVDAGESGTMANAVLKVYAVNYNVLRIMSGMGGLAYSN